MFYMHGAGWGWWVLMSIGMVAFWAAVIYFFVWLIRGAPARQADEKARDDDTPLELLGRRLAAGEISVDEYNERREALEQEPRAPGAPLSV